MSDPKKAPDERLGFKYTGEVADQRFRDTAETEVAYRADETNTKPGRQFVNAADHYGDEWAALNFRAASKLFNEDKNHWSHLLLTWFTSEFLLQRTETSRVEALHSYVESFRPAYGWVNGIPITPKSQMWKKKWNDAQVFLMQHDWAGAFAGDSDFDNKANQCKPPAPACFFEYTISGRHVIAVVQPDDSDPSHDIFDLAIAVPNGWYIAGQNSRGSTFDIFGPNSNVAWNGHQRLLELLHRQTKAACIALEAEVAETEIVRVSHKLNAARERRGKRPLPDFNILNLANRKRYVPLPADMESGIQRTSPRLHFRRSHWRHYETYRVHIKWQLVGNPDLGFIDKDYRL